MSEGAATPADSIEPTFAEIYPLAWVRRTILGICTLAVAAILVWNLPIPTVRSAVRDNAAGPFELTHLDPDWGLFAPNVADVSFYMHLEVELPDGSIERLDFPDGDRWLGAYRASRWSAYEEVLYFDEVLQDDAIAWAYRQRPDAVEIALVLVESPPSADTHGPHDREYERLVVTSWRP